MSHETDCLRYVLPRFHRGYNRAMKTLASSLKYEHSDPAKFRLHVLEYGKTHGVKAALEAFHVGRSTYFEWKQAFTTSRGKLVSLVPQSTRPHKTRRMEVDERLLTFIKSVREAYGRVGKTKLKILVAAYAGSLGVSGYGSTKIGKIIKGNHYFFDFKRSKNRAAFSRNRVRRVGKDVKPGYIELDSIVVYAGTTKLRFVTIMDVVTKVAYAERVKSGLSHHTVAVFQRFQSNYAIPIHTVQTDNGSEFLKGSSKISMTF